MTNLKPHTIKPHYVLPLKHSKLHNKENTENPPRVGESPSVEESTRKPNEKKPLSPQRSTPSSPPGLSCLSILIDDEEDSELEEVLKEREENSITEPETPTPPEPPLKPVFEFPSQETVYSGSGHNLATSTWSNQHPPSLPSRFPPPLSYPALTSYPILPPYSHPIPHTEEIFSGLALNPKDEEKHLWQDLYNTHFTLPKRTPPPPFRDSEEEEEEEEEESVYEGLGQEQEGGIGKEVGIGGLTVPSGRKMPLREIRRRWGEWRW